MRIPTRSTTARRANGTRGIIGIRGYGCEVISPFRWDPGSVSPSPLARCPRNDCRAPLRLTLGATLILTRCEQGHLDELYVVYAEGWFTEVPEEWSEDDAVRVPKPKVRKQKPRFGHRRDPQYAAWIRTQPCLLEGHHGGTQEDWHRCWGRVQVCHVKSRGAGGNDHGNIIPLCAAAHDEQHRMGIRSFAQRWGVVLADEAERLWRTYVEAGAPRAEG